VCRDEGGGSARWWQLVGVIRGRGDGAWGGGVVEGTDMVIGEVIEDIWSRRAGRMAEVGVAAGEPVGTDVVGLEERLKFDVGGDLRESALLARNCHLLWMGSEGKLDAAGGEAGSGLEKPPCCDGRGESLADGCSTCDTKLPSARTERLCCRIFSTEATSCTTKRRQSVCTSQLAAL